MKKTVVLLVETDAEMRAALPAALRELAKDVEEGRVRNAPAYHYMTDDKRTAIRVVAGVTQ